MEEPIPLEDFVRLRDRKLKQEQERRLLEEIAGTPEWAAKLSRGEGPPPLPSKSSRGEEPSSLPSKVRLCHFK